MPERATVEKQEREVSKGRSSLRRNPLWEKTEGEGPNEKEC